MTVQPPLPRADDDKDDDNTLPDVSARTPMQRKIDEASRRFDRGEIDWKELSRLTREALEAGKK